MFFLPATPSNSVKNLGCVSFLNHQDRNGTNCPSFALATQTGSMHFSAFVWLAPSPLSFKRSFTGCLIVVLQVN